MWRHQLGLKTEDEFWAVLSSGTPAPRGAPAPVRPQPGMDSWLFEGLVQMHGVAEDEVLLMDADAALALYLRLCGSGDATA